MDRQQGRARAGAVLMVILIIGAGLCLADENGILSRKQQITTKLAKAWSTLYDGNLNEAIKLTGPLTKLASDRKYRWAALEAGHLRLTVGHIYHRGPRGRDESLSLQVIALNSAMSANR